MATLNRDQLVTEITRDPTARTEFFNYLRMNHPAIIGIPNQTIAQETVEDVINHDPATLATWAGVWLPHYNRSHPDPRPIPIHHPRNPELESRLRTAFLIGATGIVTIFGAEMLIDKESTQHLFQYAGATATIASIVGAGYAYLRR